MQSEVYDDSTLSTPVNLKLREGSSANKCTDVPATMLKYGSIFFL